MPHHVGYYVHYHGLGHKHRCEAILTRLNLPCTVLTSRIAQLPFDIPTLTEVVDLACDIDDVPPQGLSRAADVPCFHYAPLWTDNCRRRVAQFTAWCDRVQPDVIVVDVSVEITLLARLASTPTIVVRQHGDRSDPAHLGAYASAERLLAPFPAIWEDEITPDWVAKKTDYTAPFARELPLASKVVLPESAERSRLKVAIMTGRGGDGLPTAELVRLARSRPDHCFFAIGQGAEVGQDDVPSNLLLTGWISEPSGYLRAADIVVTAAGHNSIMEVAMLRKRLVAIAEPRHFDEQIRKATILARQEMGVTHIGWPDAKQLGQLIDQAAQLDPNAWERLWEGKTNDGAADAATAIRRVIGTPI